MSTTTMPWASIRQLPLLAIWALIGASFATVGSPVAWKFSALAMLLNIPFALVNARRNKITREGVESIRRVHGNSAALAAKRLVEAS